MISARYAPALLILALFALIPTAIHSYAGLVLDDGHTTRTVLASLGPFSSAPSGRNETWGKRRFDSDDWFERKYTQGRDEVVLTVIRSYDLKALYHHPELAVAYHEGHTFEPAVIVRFADHPTIPVYVLRATAPDPAVSMYVLHSDGRFIDNPIRFQLRTAGELLFSGRKPMTLFFVQGTAAAGADPSDSAAAHVLFAAISSFLGGAPPSHN